MPRQIKGSWLRGYLAYTNDILSPESFSLWTGVSVIASALQRKVFIPVNQFMCYSNEYIVLIGPPGTMKSTAMRAGRELMEGAIPNLTLATDSTTREKLIINLSNSLRDGHCSMTAHSSELASFFTSSKIDMVNFLTDIYDSPATWSHDTKLGGKNTIKAPCLNLLAATTPDSFSKEVPAETSGIGLTSRMLFQHESQPRKRPWRSPPNPDKVVVRDKLRQDLAQIATLKGEYVIDPLADEFYDEWFQNQLGHPNDSEDKALDPYFARKHTHILKLAMAVAAAERDELVIFKGDIENAMAILRDTEKNMPNVFAGYGANPLAFSLQQVAMMILDAGEDGCTYGYLLALFKRDVSQEDLDRVLKTLVRMGDITESAGQGDVIYYWTEILKAKKVL